VRYCPAAFPLDQNMTPIFTEVDRITAEQLELEELARTGVPAIAQVLDVRETGIYLDDDPVIEVRLLVRVNGGPPYPAMFWGPITPSDLARAQDGGAFTARVDPHQPDRVYVDWLG
jgi:hypothetical protein